MCYNKKLKGISTMKQFLTLRNIIKMVAVVLALVGFFFMFGNQLSWGKTQLKFDEALFGDYGATLSFVGYILILLGALATCLAIFAKGSDMVKKIIVFSAAGVMVLGAIFVFVESAVFNANASKFLATHYELTAFPILAGIFAIVAALGIVASEFIVDKQLAK